MPHILINNCLYIFFFLLEILYVILRDSDFHAVKFRLKILIYIYFFLLPFEIKLEQIFTYTFNVVGLDKMSILFNDT